MARLVLGTKMQDAKLLGRALVERWPMTQEKRAAVVQELYEAAILSDDYRTKVAASRALIAADAINLKQAELWLAENGPPSEEDDEYIVESDPDIIRLEAEILARKAAIRAGDAGRTGVRSDGGQVALAETPDVIELGNQAGSNDAELFDNSVDASSAR